MGMGIAISTSIVELMHRAANEVSPNEACGLLFGTATRIDAANVVANVAADPRRHFEIDPAALFAALRAERSGGPKLVGYWHSHPNGSAIPSATDAAMAASDGKLWLIVASGAVGTWRAEQGGRLHGRFEPVELVRD